MKCDGCAPGSLQMCLSSLLTSGQGVDYSVDQQVATTLTIIIIMKTKAFSGPKNKPQPSREQIGVWGLVTWFALFTIRRSKLGRNV